MDGTETGWGRPAEPAPRWRALLDRALLGSRTGDTGEQQQVGKDEPVAEADATQRGDAGPTEVRAAEVRAAEVRAAEVRAAEVRAAEVRPADARSGAAHPLPSRHVTPRERPRALEQRPHPLDERPRALEQRPLSLEQRPAPAEPRPGAEPRPVHPLDRRPVNPLDRRGGTRDRGFEPPRPAGPLEPRPTNPLDPRRHSRTADAFHGRAEAAEAPHSYFSPATRAVPPPISRVTQQDTGYPPARAAASVGSAAVLPPPAPTAAPAAPSPTSPAPARIEWRQVSRPDADVERAVAVLRCKLGRPRVLAFANPKGGVHKTTATVLAAATIGSVRGRGVLAWDDNELRGTLGLRAGSARHARTIRHLVTDLMQIENLHGDDLTHRLDDYLRHASDGSYDVLAGEENPRFAQRLDQHTVHRVVDLLRRTHEVICVDTGNNVESVNWQTVMKTADQLVITTVPREDAAFTADWMLDLLTEIGMEDMVASAVTLISCPSAGPHPLLEDLQKHFATRTRAVTVVPYDPALEVGSSIEYSALQPETRQAWLRAASVMIEPFGE